MPKLALADTDVKDKRVLIRVDFNVRAPGQEGPNCHHEHCPVCSSTARLVDKAIALSHVRAWHILCVSIDGAMTILCFVCE